MKLIEILEMYLEEIRRSGKIDADCLLSGMVDESLFNVISGDISSSGRFKRVLNRRTYARMSKRNLGYDKK
jgi:hypothetical protein